MRQKASTLTIALSKGKLFEPAMELLARVGLISRKISRESRRLVFENPASGTTIMIVRPSDVPTYVEYGAVDAGIETPLMYNGVASVSRREKHL